MTGPLPFDLKGLSPAHVLDALDRADCEDSLYEFVRQMWHVVEPSKQMSSSWVMQAICEHLEAVTYGDITRLLINVPPGSSKSLLCNVFWPAWEWAKFPHLRYLSFSYAAHLTERDNRKFRDVIMSPRYQALFGDRFSLLKRGEEYVSNEKTGFKLATSVGGVGTGERGDRVILDDPHNVADQESDTIRKGTVEWFSTAMSNRLNDMEQSAIVVIMQRVHEEDVSGFILDNELPYEHLMIPAEFEPERRVVTCIGWSDPREDVGEIFWPERFPEHVLKQQKKLMGSFGYSGQYQQRPDPAGGGIIKDDWWKLWPDEPCDNCPRKETRIACQGCSDSKVKCPPFDFIVAYVDTAYTEKTMNDYSAMTVWGVFEGVDKHQPTRLIDSSGRVSYMDTSPQETTPKLMMVNAWQARLEIHDLVIKIAETATKFKVDRVLIENKASGISVAQELKRLYRMEKFGVQLNDPKSQDKIARLYSVQHLFQEGMVYAPEREWARMVMSQVGAFPKGKHDDLVDTVSGAIRYLRDIGLLTRAPERLEEIEESKRYTRPAEPLYPA